VPTYTLDRAPLPAGSAGADGGVAERQLREQLEALGYIDEEGRPDASIGQSRRQR
jgi:hypothetical protein